MEELEVVNNKTLRKVLLERRLMAAGTVGTLVSIALFVVAVATNYWVIINIHDKVDDANRTIVFHLGIWGEWRTDTIGSNTTSVWIRHFPDPPPERTRLEDIDLPHYFRAQAAFSIISLVLMLMSNFFAFYSFNQHRYMFKRATFGLHGLVALCVLVVIQVLVHAISTWKSVSKTAKSDPDLYWRQMKYGFSTVLAWMVFGVYALAAIVFVVASRKRKGSRAATQEFEEEDRPMQLGR